MVRLDVPPSIEWWCSACGDDGVVSGWEGSPFDLRGPSSHAGAEANKPAERLDSPSVATPSIVGRWRIIAMELWDQDAIDLLGPGFFEFRGDNSGSFRFIAVEAWMDVRPSDRDGRPGVEFSWEGHDDGDRTSGRGWATLAADGTLTGRILFHLGDDSSFLSIREAKEGVSDAGVRRPRLGQ